MKITPSTKISRLASKMRASYDAPSPMSRKINPGYIKQFKGFERILIQSSLLNIELNPTEYGLFGQVASDRTLTVFTSLLTGYKSNVFTTQFGNTGFFFGKFCFSELKKNDFGACVLLSGGKAPGLAIEQTNLMEKIPGYSPEEILNAQAFLTFEAAFETQVFSEQLVYVPHHPIESFYKINFGHELNIEFVFPSAKTSAMN